MQSVFTEDFIYMSLDDKYDDIISTDIVSKIKAPHRSQLIMLLWIINKYKLDKVHCINVNQTIKETVKKISPKFIFSESTNDTQFIVYEDKLEIQSKVGDFIYLDKNTLPKKLKYHQAEIMWTPWSSSIVMRATNNNPYTWDSSELYMSISYHDVYKSSLYFLNIKTLTGKSNYDLELTNDYDSSFEAFTLSKYNIVIDDLVNIITETLDMEPLSKLRQQSKIVDLGPFKYKQPSIAHYNRISEETASSLVQYDIDNKIKSNPVFLLTDIQEDIPYTTTVDKINPYNIHIGQRKLLDSEWYFLNTLSEDTGLIVYIGSAPGFHIGALSKYWPKFKFLLIDGNNIYPKTSQDKTFYLQASINIHENMTWAKDYTGKRYNISELEGKVFDITLLRDVLDKAKEGSIFIYEDFMTIDIARQLTNIKDKVYFWSDIRTSFMIDKVYGGPSDADILINSAQHITWIDIIKPDKYFIKFRPPFYFTRRYQEIANQITIFDQPSFIPYAEYINEHFNLDYKNELINGTFSFLLGDIVLQPWTATTSVETRLMGDGKLPLIIAAYSIGYRDKLFYYNNVLRLLRYPNTHPLPNKSPYTCTCGDCAYEYHIIKQYIDKYKPKMTLHEIQSDFNNYMGEKVKTLQIGDHPLQ